MVRKASFSVEISTKHSTAHNNRTEPPKYLLGLEPNTQNYYGKLNGYESDHQFIELMAQKYKMVFRQKMQGKQRQSMIKEAVISLEKHHNENDVLRLFKKLGDAFGGHIPLELSIHHDEGHYVKDGVPFYPNKNIVQKSDRRWYLIDGIGDFASEYDTDFTVDFFNDPVDISEFRAIYNYHAHVKFTMINMMGIVPSFENDMTLHNRESKEITEQDRLRTAKMNKKMMQARLQIVAEHLGMLYAPNPRTSRIKKSIAQAKDDHEAQRKKDLLCAKHKRDIEEIKRKQKTVSAIYQSGLVKIINTLKAKQKITHQEIEAMRKAYEQEMLDSDEFYTKEDYLDLKNRFEKLKKEVQNQSLTIEQLRDELKSLEDQNESLNHRYEQYNRQLEEKDKYIVHLKEQLRSKTDEATSSVSFLNFAKARNDELNRVVQAKNEYIEKLKDLSYTKDESGNFDTIQKNDGKTYYRTYKAENKKLRSFKNRAVSFFNKVAGFLGLSNNLQDANNELDIMIEEKKQQKLKMPTVKSSGMGYGGGMRL
jgi:hypothetical protein